MDLLIVILYCHSIRHWLRKLLKIFLALLVRLLLQLLIILGLTFAHISNGFFFSIIFTLFVIPSWIWACFGASVPDYCGNDDYDSSNHVKGPAELEGWCRIVICPTDDISTLDLESNRGAWENREMMAISKEELGAFVKSWAGSVGAEDRY